MTPEQARVIATDDELRKRLAKFLALQCFRNSELENLHAGQVPDSKTGDYSDVKVISPYGEIPWTELSRFNDAEMKGLMSDVVNRCYTWLTVLFCSETGLQAILDPLQQGDAKPDWEEPKLVSL